LEQTLNPTTSIVIPAHNEAHFLRGLLESIRRVVACDVEIVVVDNGSVDDTAAIAQAQGCVVRKLDRRVYPSVARNLGAATSRGSLLVFLDADVVLSPEWGAELSSSLKSLHKHPVLVTGDQCHISQHPGWLERVWFDALRAKTPTYIDGANLIATRAAFDRIGGFSEHLETSEDVDFCMRAVSNGAQLLVNPGFKVFHEGYPKAVSGFVKRERWHGRSDFRTIRSVIASKVAVATCAFVALHVCLVVALLSSLVFGHGWGVVAASSTLVLLLCLASCAQKFRRISLSRVLLTVPVMYLYYVGRGGALLDALRARGTGARARHR
jgi:glycosyltransferase involved in cell wall biosynthesis